MLQLLLVINENINLKFNLKTYLFKSSIKNFNSNLEKFSKNSCIKEESSRKFIYNKEF